MSEPLGDTGNDRSAEYILETDLDASPDTVWRALSEPALREAWLAPCAADDPLQHRLLRSRLTGAF